MNLDSIKSKLNALQSKGQKKEKVDFSKYLWKPKAEGKYQIRIVPSKNNPDNPFKEVFIHYGFSKFPIYALTNWGEKDPIVEFAKKLRSSNEKENWALAKKLDPKMRVFAPIIVRGEEDKGVRLWEFGKEIYMQLLGIADDEDYGDYTDIKDGRDFTLEVITGDIGGRQGLKSTLRIKPKTSPLGADKKQIELWLSEQPDIMELQANYKINFDKLKEILQNWLTPEEPESEIEDEDEDEVDIKSAKTPTSQPAFELKSDLPWEDEDEEEEEVKPIEKTPKVKPKQSKADKFDQLFEND